MKKENLSIYRKRLIPEECILLKDDIILEVSEKLLITKWHTLKPKKELHHGISCYCLTEGFKISKFFRADHSVICWYCDIIDFQYDEASNVLVATDLLADVIIYSDKRVQVVDIDEMALALEKKLCSQATIIQGLKTLDKLLSLAYKNGLEEYFSQINQWDSPDAF